jgi:cysteine desulfuration protein SufE
MNMPPRTLADLEESFALFDNWEDRYRYLIELGGRLDPMEDSLKTDETLVRGCTSRVWLIAETKGRQFHFTADSDAQIVRGLIYLLIVAYQDKLPAKIKKVDIESAFERMGLHQHLSPSRRNGFFAMVERIKMLAGG